MTGRDYDLVVLGGGAAAFAAVTEAGRRGLSTAIVNAGLPLGGTCVNVGCVPSKHLLAVADTAHVPESNPFEAIEYGGDQPRVDWAGALDGTDRLVESMRDQNYVDVADHYGVDVYEGRGQFASAEPGSVTVEVADGPDAGADVTGEYGLVATGSSPSIPDVPGIESVAFETSESILDRRDRPESVVVLGGGYVGCEWGQILHRMGVDVTLVQRSGHVLSDMWPELGRDLQRHLRDDGITVVTNATPERVEATGDGVAVELDAATGTRTVTASDLFVATGVDPNTSDAGLPGVGVDTDDAGAVVVDEFFQTTNPAVYAAGDCVGDPMLETVAAKEGNHAVRNAFWDERAAIDYDAVPEVVYTSPEVASVGVTEPEYVDEHGTCSCRTVRMTDVPKARAVEDTRGLLQVVKHHETDEIVGVHTVSPRAADVIPEATLAVKFGLTVDDVIDTIHPFPTFSEAFKHACQAFRRDTATMSCCVE